MSKHRDTSLWQFVRSTTYQSKDNCNQYLQSYLSFIEFYKWNSETAGVLLTTKESINNNTTVQQILHDSRGVYVHIYTYIYFCDKNLIKVDYPYFKALKRLSLIDFILNSKQAKHALINCQITLKIVPVFSRYPGKTKRAEFILRICMIETRPRNLMQVK